MTSAPSLPLLAAAILATLATPAAAQVPAAFTGKVVAVADGDTITVLTPDNTKTRVRLHGIDAPERGQAFGTRARQAIGDLLTGQAVTVTPTGPPDRYRRTIARVSLDDRDIGQQLLATGMAWHYTRYDSSSSYAQAERDARAARRGLWTDPKPVPPWEWRRLPKAERLLIIR